MRCTVPAVLAALLCYGCASGGAINAALTPGPEILQDKYDNATIVRQTPVSASRGMSDEWHTLGFEWVSKNPKIVYVTAGAQGYRAIDALGFNADGEKLENIRLASDVTERDHGWATRRFSMPLADFLKVARARTVHMRIGRINEYSVSTFGSDHPNATVNAKFKPFTDKVLQLGAGL